jgi:hypothetical protein
MLWVGTKIPWPLLTLTSPKDTYRVILLLLLWPHLSGVVSIGFAGFYVSISVFPFSHVLAQTAAWNLIKIAHNVYLISLSRWKNPVSFSTNFRANIDFGSNISSRSLNSINRIVGTRTTICIYDTQLYSISNINHTCMHVISLRVTCIRCSQIL